MGNRTERNRWERALCLFLLLGTIAWQKLGLAVGMFLSGQVLGINGYIRGVPGEPPPIQPESALTAIRVLVGPVGAAILLLSFVAVYLYPITQARHRAIQAQLAARRAQG